MKPQITKNTLLPLLATAHMDPPPVFWFEEQTICWHGISPNAGVQSYGFSHLALSTQPLFGSDNSGDRSNSLHYRIIEKIGAGGMDSPLLVKKNLLTGIIAVALFLPDLGSFTSYPALQAPQLGSAPLPHIPSDSDEQSQERKHFAGRNARKRNARSRLAAILEPLRNVGAQS